MKKLLVIVIAMLLAMGTINSAIELPETANDLLGAVLENYGIEKVAYASQIFANVFQKDPDTLVYHDMQKGKPVYMLMISKKQTNGDTTYTITYTKGKKTQTGTFKTKDAIQAYEKLEFMFAAKQSTHDKENVSTDFRSIQHAIILALGLGHTHVKKIAGQFEGYEVYPLHIAWAFRPQTLKPHDIIISAKAVKLPQDRYHGELGTYNAKIIFGGITPPISINDQAAAKELFDILQMANEYKL